jgi:hypothetical protein
VRDIARRDGVREGLICVLSALERCKAFDVRGDHKTRRLQIVRRLRKCLHFYFYFLDPEFGFMRVRLQSWHRSLRGGRLQCWRGIGEFDYTGARKERARTEYTHHLVHVSLANRTPALSRITSLEKRRGGRV